MKYHSPFSVKKKKKEQRKILSVCCLLNLPREC